MNRREFIKSTIALAVVPVLPVLAVGEKSLVLYKGSSTGKLQSVPSRYRGFDISITSTSENAPKSNNGVPMKWVKPKGFKYFYAQNGTVHNGVYFDGNKSDIDIWTSLKPTIDRAIERWKKTSQ